jgi:predicted ribosomally synthesized peptide with SipW-like signal peptide
MVAAACGVALLCGGTTFALWSDTDTIPGNSIWAGNLEIEAGPPDVWDVSVGRYANNSLTTLRPRKDETQNLMDGRYSSCGFTSTTAASTAGFQFNYGNGRLLAHDIQSPWNAVPEDRVLAVYPIKIALEGDNLVADLTLQGVGRLTDWLFINDGNGNAYNPQNPPSPSQPLDLKVWLFLDGQPAKDLLTSMTPVAGTGYSKYLVTRLQAANQPGGTLEGDGGVPGDVGFQPFPVVTATTISANPNACIVLDGTFKDHNEREFAQQKLFAILQDLTVGLEQTRRMGVGHFVQ